MKLLDLLFKKKTNDIKEFLNYVGKSEYLQERETRSDAFSTAAYLQDLVYDIEDGVVKVINVIEEIPDQGNFYKPVHGQHGHIIHQVNGKKRILLIYYEYIERDEKDSD